MKVVLLEYIPDCLGTDRVGDDIVDEMGSLNSIVKLPSGDLVYDGLFVLTRKLRRVISFAVFLVFIEFLLDPTNGRPPHTSFRLDLTQEIAFMKKGDDGSALNRRGRMHMVVGRKEGC